LYVAKAVNLERTWIFCKFVFVVM